MMEGTELGTPSTEHKLGMDFTDVDHQDSKEAIHLACIEQTAEDKADDFIKEHAEKGFKTPLSRPTATFKAAAALTCGSAYKDAFKGDAFKDDKGKSGCQFPGHGGCLYPDGKEGQCETLLVSALNEAKQALFGSNITLAKQPPVKPTLRDELYTTPVVATFYKNTTKTPITPLLGKDALKIVQDMGERLDAISIGIVRQVKIDPPNTTTTISLASAWQPKPGSPEAPDHLVFWVRHRPDAFAAIIANAGLGVGAAAPDHNT